MEAMANSEEDDINGDIIVVNDDNALSNSLTTPVASRAIIQDVTTSNTTPEASASLLLTTSSASNNSMMLREWTATPNSTSLQHLPNISSPIPPVAPAVLLIQREGSSNSATTCDATATRSSHSYQYPVATFVTNLVRSVSEYRPPCNMHQMQMQINIEAPPRAILETPASVTTANNDNNCVSDNSNDVSINSDAVPIIPVKPSQTALSNANASGNLNAPLVADFEDDNQDWMMINGELMRLDCTQEDVESNEFDSHRRSSKSSRMQRGVRRFKKLKNIFLGGNRVGDGQKKKGDRNKIAGDDSTRRKQIEYKHREQGKFQQENPDHTDSLEFRNYESHEFNDFGDGGELSIQEAPNGRLRRNTASDRSNDSGDGSSLIEASNPQQISHHTSLTAISNNSGNDNNKSHNGDNSTLSTNKFHSEEFSIRTGSLRSTYSGHTNNVSSSSSNSNQGQKKKTHRLPRWLGGTATASSSSNRSILSNVSSGSGSSLLRKKRHKQLHSSSPQTINEALPPTPPTINGKPAALEPQRSGRGFMPPLREISKEISSSSLQLLPPSSFVAQSPLHVPPRIGSTGDLYGVPSVSSGQNKIQRSTSIAAHASLVCHENSITSEAALLPQSEYYIEARFDEYDKYDDKNMKGIKNSIKADKHMGPSIDMMLERAGEIATSMQDEDAPRKVPPSQTKSTMTKGKSDGESVPLSRAGPGDKVVHNDILKLVLVGDNAVDKNGLGRLLRKSTKKPRQRTGLAVDVHPWMTRFTIWEVLTSKSEDPYLPNFGARPGTQSLFFSDQSLYLLVYDLGASNPETLRNSKNSNDSDSDDECSGDEWDEYHNAFLREKANKEADIALEADIKERVLSWVDCIARRGPHSAILPIALLPSQMSTEESERRLHIMKTVILNYEEKFPSNIVRPKILCSPETNVIWVSLHNNILGDLEKIILDIADASHDVFDHVGRPVPPGTVEIMNVCRALKKKKQKLILVDHLIAKLPEFSVEDVTRVLKFLATIGEVLYFGDSNSVLKDYVILCRKWLVGALSCILRNDLQREVSETRNFFQFNDIYRFPESDVTQTFSGNNSSCPILSSQDTQMLWQSANFLMQAVDPSLQRSENLMTTSTMFDFLQHLLEHTGVFLPLEIDRFSKTDRMYFVPSLLSQASFKDVWTYKSSEAWMVTLCHSWLFRDGAPVGLMEQVTIALLRDLYESSRANAETPTKHGRQPRSNHHLQGTLPFGQSSDSHDGEPIGPISIHQINCWKSSLIIQIGRIFPKGNEYYESKIEIFVAVTDQVSPHNVASDVMQSNMQRLVVSGKGEVGLHGQKLWKGGYNIVLDSIKASVANCTNVERQVVCPECLAYRPARSVNTWSWDSVLAASDDTVRCMMGHRVDRHLICGTAPVITTFEDGGKVGNADKKPIIDLLPSVVIVGLWDNETKTIHNVGSGFIANKKLGLIVTASHILFNMAKGRGFGESNNQLRNFRAIIGVIPSEKKNDTTAVFRYFAEIVANDIHNMDACILKITNRLENDVQNHSLVGEQPERLLLPKNIQEESLSSLIITRKYEIEQRVRIIGFNQGGEGRLERGRHVNTILDYAEGSILKQFKISDDESTSSDDSSSSNEGVLKPREEIVVSCRTIIGHSGGPCVNDDGKVVGILSRSDPADPNRCYLVPSSEIKILISKAKRRLGMDMGY